jgi:filamentous hemagglutinin family protein
VKSHLYSAILLLAASLLFFPSICLSEITLDGTLGQSGPLTGPDYLITDDMGQQAGGNLFHSFGEFNIFMNESATFTGHESIENIISRVTGGNPSFIDGRLSTTIQNANMYFLNPAGMMFGPSATLDVGGSFHASTADYLVLGDSVLFSATRPANSVLTVAPPSAFGFLNNSPTAISIEGSFLEVPEGETLSLIGGDISLDSGTLYVPGGQIHIASVASDGEVTLGETDLDVESFNKLGEIRIRNGAIFNEGQGPGTVFIRSGRLIMEQSGIGVTSTGNVPGISIDIGATEEMEMSDGFINSQTISDAPGGDILIETGTLTLKEGAQIGTSTSSNAQAGEVNVFAHDSCSISGQDSNGFFSTIYSATFSSGSAGRIYVSSPDLNISDKGRILNSRSGTGSRGDVVVDAGRLTLTSDGIIAGANITVNVDTLKITDGAYIWSPATGSGENRVVNINARDSILITGQGERIEPWRGRTDPLYTGIHTDVFVTVDGNAGDIILTAPSITITNSGQVGARTYTDGHGGDITVNAGRVKLLSGGQIAANSVGSSLSDGLGGNVTVNATESVLISGENGNLSSGLFSTTRSGADAGLISVSTPHLSISESGRIAVATGVFGEGSPGEISINVNTLELLSGGGISSSSAGFGGEGSISITAQRSILINDGFLVRFGFRDGKPGNIELHAPSLSMNNGSISTTAFGFSDGGDIRINVDSLSMANDSKITSESEGSGNAGNILINSSNIFRSEASSVTTASERSAGGNIEITAGSLQLTNGSKVTATVAGGEGGGGNVTIDAISLAALEDSDITARADQGFGGNIKINAQVVLFSDNIDLDASSNVEGREGSVEVDSPLIDISGGLVSLPETFLDAKALLPARCESRNPDLASSFVVLKRGGLTSGPDRLLPCQ